MSAISPIPSSRVSDQLIRSRMLAQLQAEQQNLFRVQTQVSTGRRISVPSEDAPAALRAISLQRLIERKTQVSANLSTNLSYLSATDSALHSVSGILSGLRGAALGVAGTDSSDSQRAAVAVEVERAIEQLIDTGNQRFRGRYLFAGTRTTVLPFQRDNGYVSYLGNEGELTSYSDIDALFPSSISGNEVFGTISEPVRGTADLNPVLTSETLLEDLRGGQGISVGSLNVSDGTQSRIIDISPARTVGDLARLIEANPPSGRTLTVTVKPTGLDIAIDSAGGGSLTVTEVAGGTTASELGILRESGSYADPIVGKDLDPVLKLTTRLDDVFGARAYARIVSSGTNNDILLSATSVGAEFSGATIQFVDDDLLQAAPGLEQGSEQAVYHETAQPARASLTLLGSDNDLVLTAKTAGIDYNNVQIQFVDAGDVKNNPTATYTDVAGVRTLTLGIDDSGETTVQALVDAIDASTPFTASADPSAGEGFDGAGLVQTANIGAVTGDTGNSGGAAKTLYVHVQAGATSAADAVTAINAEGTFSASLDRRDSVTAAQTGIGPVDLAATATTRGGAGFAFDKTSGIQITNGGQTYEISFNTAETVEDLLNIINGSGAGALAEINAAGTGIDLRSRLSGADFSVGENGGATATQLGVRSFTGDTRLEDLNYGRGVQIIEGTDFTIIANDGAKLEIDLSGARTIGDVLDAINNHPDNTGPSAVTARLATHGNGIELVDDNPQGFDSSGAANRLRVERATLGLAAEHLGLVPVGANESQPATAATAATASADLSGANTDLAFTASDAGTAMNDVQIVFVNSAAVGDQALVSYDAGNKTLTIDVDPAATRATTVAQAVTAEGTFTATLSTSAGPNSGQGIITDTGAVATTAGGTPEVLRARNVHPEETHGIFNSLTRLKDALASNDVIEIQRALDLLDEDIERVNFARAEIGARQQGLEVLQTRLGTEEVELRNTLSLEIEVDFAAAVSEMTARQFAYQAALRTTASVLQQTLLNYL